MGEVSDLGKAETRYDNEIFICGDLFCHCSPPLINQSQHLGYLALTLNDHAPCII